MYSCNSGYNNDTVQCPFNKYHIIPSSSLQRHIVKCEKNYPPDYKVICPYNATHRLSKQEIAEHINTCPTRKTIEASHIPQSWTHDSVVLQEEYDSINITDREDNEGEMRPSENDSSFIDEYDKYMENDTESLFNVIRHGRGMPHYADFLRNESMRSTESIIGAMGIERNRMTSHYTESLQDKSDTDADTESIVSSMGIGRGRIMHRHAEFRRKF